MTVAEVARLRAEPEVWRLRLRGMELRLAPQRKAKGPVAPSISQPAPIEALVLPCTLGLVVGDRCSTRTTVNPTPDEAAQETVAALAQPFEPLRGLLAPIVKVVPDLRAGLVRSLEASMQSTRLLERSADAQPRWDSNPK